MEVGRHGGDVVSYSTLREQFYSSPDGEGNWFVRISSESEWGDYGMDHWTAINGRLCETVLPFFGHISDCPVEVLDKRFYTGFGAPDRPMFTVWTPSFIIPCTEYDGSTGSRSVERHATPW
jgi:hypothetical protein